jgi:hypothetical protein
MGITRETYLHLTILFCLLVVITVVVNRQVKEHLLQDDPMLEHLRMILIDVHPVVSDLKLYKSDKSYTLNKEKVFLCLRDKNNQYYPLNMLLYVSIHEIAHVLCKSHGHTEEFYQIFDTLLKRAQDIGVYSEKIPQVKNYIGASES